MNDIFDRYSPEMRAQLLQLRELIFSVAAGIEQVGELEETLKWNQPSYLTAASRSGTTIRIDQVGDSPHHYAMYVHCQTSLIETFRLLYPDLVYEGDRAIIFDSADELPAETVKDCIGLALTYHLRKKQKSPTTTQ
jgi:hypothetical protein